MSGLDERVRALLAVGDTGGATTVVLRELGPEIFGFLSGVLDDVDVDDVFSPWSERLWRSLRGFEGRCLVRTWAYVLARHELGRFRKRVRRHARVCVPISENILEIPRSAALAIDKRRRLARLRDNLPLEDRTLLTLRVERDLAWDEIALAFAENPESFTDADRKREAARLRKRFQLVKERLVARMGRPRSPQWDARQSAGT